MPRPRRVTPGIRHLIDIVLGTILVRMAAGWLASSHRLLRRLLSLGAVIAVLVILVLVDLPVSRLSGLVLLVPLALGLLWSSLPDFARATRTLMSGRPFAFRRPPPSESDPLLDALVELGRLRIGALVILPRADDVTPLLSGGEDVTADVNRSLMLSIFHPGAPRHDGAVVVEGGRIVRIGAVMPLASAEAVPTELGTRHLAALGLSERCDADVLVVSEERGTISRARHGHLAELTAEDSTSPARLGAALRLSDPRLGRLRERARSAALWAAAAAIAVTGSLGADRLKGRLFPATEETTIVQAPLAVTNVPAGYFVADLSATSCQMYVRARRQGPSLSLQEPPKLEVDLHDLPPGSNRISLMASMTRNLRPGWRIERFEPPEISFTLARLRTLDIPVVPAMAGLRRPLRVVAARSRPALVKGEVRDPAWGASDHLETLPVDLRRVPGPGSYTFDTEINLPASIDLHGQKKVAVVVEIQGAGGATVARSASPP